MKPDAYTPFGGDSFWIWSSEGCARPNPDDSGAPYRVRRFLRTFTVDDLAGVRLDLHISADSIYLLYCNGRFVGRGPAKGDVRHQFYDSWDVAPCLKKGANLLASIVVDYSRSSTYPPELGAPTSRMVNAGGLVVDALLRDRDGVVRQTLHTNPQWKVQVDKAYDFQSEQNLYGGFVGYFEHKHIEREPAGWTRPDFDATDWESARVLYPGERCANSRDAVSPYGLMPRMIPALEEDRQERFDDAFLPGGGDPGASWKDLVSGPKPMTVPAGTRATVIVDAGRLTTGYPCFVARGGHGASVRMTYGEALRLPYGTPEARILGAPEFLENVAVAYADRETGWTIDRRGKMTGWCDICDLAGRKTHYEPLHWRTFRFIQLDIETSEEALTIEDVYYRFSAYPFDIRATFACSSETWNDIWATSLWTMRLCSHETFEDCPYYEQLQYAGDTVITSRLAMLTSGDTRLSRQAVYQFAWSLRPEGITASRYPSRQEQVIPSWSLHWISLVKDYYLFSGDTQAIRDCLFAMQSVLQWFERRNHPTMQLPGPLPHWNTTDWCPKWDRGQPPGWDKGPTCVISCQYLNALRELKWMLKEVGEIDAATELADKITATRDRINQHFWSHDDGLYYDRPGGPELSQYGNAWAIYADVPDPTRTARMMERFPIDPDLAPTSFFGTYYVFEAMRMVDALAPMGDLLAPWVEMLDAGLTTWAEETAYWRSLCHSWSAHPALAIIQSIMGISVTEPGFKAVTIDPNLLVLDNARLSIPTPKGILCVELSKDRDVVVLQLEAPAAIEVAVVGAETQNVCTENGCQRLTCRLARRGSEARQLCSGSTTMSKEGYEIEVNP